MCASFQAKWTTLPFFAQICPKMDLWLETQETNAGIRISILEIPCVPIFRENEQLRFFRPKFVQKWILGLKFQKSKCEFWISTSKIPCVPIFRQNGQLWIFHLDLGKLLNYMWYFGSNDVDCVAENLVEAEMNWVKVGARFSSILKFINFTSRAALWQKTVCSRGNL